jgi:hypothetical protein
VTPAAHLRLVNAETGEVHEGGCPECSVKDDTIAGLNRKMNGMAAEITALRRDRDLEAREHPHWDVIEALYDLWRRECGHTRSTFTAEDFWLAVVHYERHGWDMCERAIVGMKFDCWRKRRKNGSWKRFDDWADHIFKDRPHFEEACNKAPRDFKPRGLPEAFRTEGRTATA